MNSDEKKKYLNQKLNNPSFYSGPKLLYKYRAFDHWTFDMLENNYLFFCKAKNEDDETECMAELENIRELSPRLLRFLIIEILLDEIRDRSSIDTFNSIRQMVFQCTTPDFHVRVHFLMDFFPQISGMVPGYNVAPLLNYLSAIPNSVDDNIFYNFCTLIRKALSAREEIGICSLSDSPFIDDLWERYGDHYSGCCIEYEVDKCDWITNDLFPVVYENQREYGILICLLKNYINSCKNDMKIDFNDRDTSHYLRLFITKYEKWSQQREWRVIGQSEERRKAPKISKIYLGKTVNENDRLKILELCGKLKVEVVEL